MAADPTRRVFHASEAPPAIGPYSHAVSAGGLLFCSGQIALDPATGELDGAGAGEQARRCLENLDAVCRAASTRLHRAIRVTVYVVGLGERWAEVNEAYGEWFGEDPPARAAIGVAELPKGALVEIDAVVAL